MRQTAERVQENLRAVCSPNDCRLEMKGVCLSWLIVDPQKLFLSQIVTRVPVQPKKNVVTLKTGIASAAA